MNVTAGSWPGIILWNEIQHRFQIRVNFIYFSSLLSPPRLQISIASSWRRSRDLLFWEGASVAPRRHLKWLFRMRSVNYITLYYVDSQSVKTPACKIPALTLQGWLINTVDVALGTDLWACASQCAALLFHCFPFATLALTCETDALTVTESCTDDHRWLDVSHREGGWLVLGERQSVIGAAVWI